MVEYPLWEVLVETAEVPPTRHPAHIHSLCRTEDGSWFDLGAEILGWGMTVLVGIPVLLFTP